MTTNKDEHAWRSPLHIDDGELNKLASLVAARSADRFRDVRGTPVSQPAPDPAMLRDQVFPEHGDDPAAIVDFILQHIMPYPMGNDHPRFFAWVEIGRAHV